MSDGPFIVHAWPVDGSQPATVQRQPTFLAALVLALGLASDPAHRMTQVTDDYSSLWAQIGPISQITEAPSQ